MARPQKFYDVVQDIAMWQPKKQWSRLESMKSAVSKISNSLLQDKIEKIKQKQEWIKKETEDIKKRMQVEEPRVPGTEDALSAMDVLKRNESGLKTDWGMKKPPSGMETESVKRTPEGMQASFVPEGTRDTETDITKTKLSIERDKLNRTLKDEEVAYLQKQYNINMDQAEALMAKENKTDDDIMLAEKYLKDAQYTAAEIKKAHQRHYPGNTLKSSEIGTIIRKKKGGFLGLGKERLVETQVVMDSEDKEMYDWALTNKSDPRAETILKYIQERYGK